MINNVRAVQADDIERVAFEIATADIMATAVGVNALSMIARPISIGLRKRWYIHNATPLNILLCENLFNAKKTF